MEEFEKISRARFREHTLRQARRRRLRIVASVIFCLVWFLLTVTAIILIRTC